MDWQNVTLRGEPHSPVPDDPFLEDWRAIKSIRDFWAMLSRGGLPRVCTPVVKEAGKGLRAKIGRALVRFKAGGLRHSAYWALLLPPLHAMAGTLHGFHQDLGYRGSQWDTRANLVAAIGSKVSRTTAVWSSYEVTQGEIEWAYLDGAIAAIRNARMTPLITISSSPQWANGSPDRWVVPGTDQTDPLFDAWVSNYVNWVDALVSRYSNDVERWELWNEQDQHHFWKQGGTSGHECLACYVEWYAAVRDRILSIQTNAQVAVGGVVDNYTRNDGDWTSFFLRDLITVYSAKVDYVAFHAYDQDSPLQDTLWQNNFTNVRDLRENLNNAGLSRVPIWITEWGWYTSQWSESTRASYMQAAFEMMRGNPDWNVDLTCYFFDIDTPDYPDAGVFDEAMNPKPILVDTWSEQACYDEQQDTTAPNPPRGLGVR